MGRAFIYSKLSRTIFLSATLFFAFSNNTFAASRYWVGGATGAWNVTTSWSATSGGASGVAAPVAADDVYFDAASVTGAGGPITVNTLTGTLTIHSLTITGNANVTLTASTAGTVLHINNAATANPTALSITSGSTLILGSTNTFTLDYGATASQVATIAGTMQVNTSNTYTATNSITTVSGTITNGTGNGSSPGTISSTAANLLFAGTGITGSYNHNCNGGAIPTALWVSGTNYATLNITGITNTNPTNFTGTYGNLIWNCTGQTTATGAATGVITVSYNLTISAGTLSDGSFQITGNASGSLTVANGATLQIGIGTATVEAFPTLWTNAHISLAAGSTVNYNTTGAQPISNVPTYANLTLTGASIKTLQTGTVTINGNLNVATSGETFVDGGFQIVGNSSGTCTVASGATLQIGAAGATTEGFPTNFTNGNIFLSGSTVNYNTTGAQPISGVPTYGNLTLTGASIKTLGASTTVTGALNIATPVETFADGGYTITVKGNVVNNASHTGTGKIYLNGGAAVHNLSGGGTFANLELNDANGASMIGPIIIGSALTNALTLTNGTFTVGAFTLTLNGAAIGGIGTNLATGNTSSLVFGPGTSNVNTGLYIPSSVTNLSSLTINIAATNKVALNSNVTLNFAGTAALTLTSGLIDLGSNNLTIGATNGTISGGTAASYILATGSGQLMKTFAAATATTFTFPIGDNATASDYTPVSLNSFTPSGGTLTVGVRVTNGTHPNMNTSTSQTNYLKRYWSFTTSGAATSYTYATGTSFTYLPSDNQGTLSNANDQLDFWDGSNWNNLNSTVTTTAATTTQQFDNVSAPLNGNDFTVRLEASKTYTWNNNAGGAWTTATNWTPTRTTPSNTDVLIFNGSTTPSAVTVTAVPSQKVAQLQVINGANVSLQSTASSTLTLGLTANTNVLTIDGTSTLQLSSTGAVATTIAFPTTPSGLSTTIAGTIILNQNMSNNNALNFINLTAANNTITGTITNNGGVVVSTASATKFVSGSAYTHNVSTAVAVPTAIWDPASLCSISGNNITSLFPTGFSAQTFGKFTWNCPNQTGAASLALAAGTTFAGDVTISSTGSGSLSLGSSAVTITMSGNLTLNGGTLIQNSAATVTTLNIAGNLTVGNGTNTTVYNLASGAATQLLNVSGSLTINSNGTLNFSSSSAGGNLSVKGDITNNGTINTAATGSVLTMNGTSPQTINAGGTWTTGTTGRLLNLNISNSAGVTLNATFAVQNLLTLTAGALTSSTLTIGVPATPVTVTRLAGSLTNVPNFNYTTGAYAINYNSSGTNYTVLNELPAAGTPTNGVLTVSTATTTVTLDKDANIGTLTTSVLGATFNVNTHTLGLSSATPLNNTGTLTANASGSTIKLNGGVNQTLTVAGTYTGSIIDNLIVANASTFGTTMGNSFNVNNLTINSGAFFSLGAVTFTLGLSGTYNNNGTLTANGTGATLEFKGAAAQTFTVGTYTGTVITNVKISNYAAGTGVTLLTPLNATTLTLNTNAILTTTTALLTVTGTTAANVSGGSATAFVYGPLARTLPASTSGIVWNYPIAKTAYQLFTLTNPVTSSAGTVVVTAEVFDANSGGTAGAGLSTINTNRYWTVSASGAGAITSIGSISLTESGMTNGTSAIGQSNTVSGTYQFKGGTVASNIITSTGGINSTLGFFVVGAKNNNLCPGPFTVGPTGDFGSIADVAGILNGSTPTCNLLFELQPTYTSSSETFPIAFTNINNGSNTITIRPQSSVSSTLVTSGDPGASNPLINLNGAKNIVLDGRPGSTGTAIKWTIQNTRTTTAGPAIQFTAGASNNTLQYLTIQSSNATSTSGTVYLFPNTVTNSGDIIQNCDIGSNGSNYHMNAICAYGNGTTIINTGIQILNNDIHDFIGSVACGILVTGNGTNTNYGDNFTITGNSLYRTVGNSLSDASVIGINFIPSPTSSGTSSGNTISGNYVGGNASARVGSAIIGTFISSAANSNQNSFMGIQISAKGITISNNVIGGIFNLMVSNQSGMTGIDLLNGCSGGTVAISGNTVGSTQGPGSTYWGTSTTSVTLGTGSKSFITQTGLGYQTGDNIIISTQAATLSTSYTSIMVGTVTSYSGTSLVVNVSSILGSGTYASWNINIASGMVNNGQFMLEGIWAGGSGSTTGTVATCNVTNNTVGNLINTNGNSFVCAGIITQNGIYTVTGNTVYNLASQCAISTSQLYTGNYGSVVGISQQSVLSGATQTVSNNTVYNLYGTYASTNANAIYGIELNGVAISGTTHAAEANLVYNLSTPNTSTGALIYGMFLRTGVYRLANNMVRLGLRSDGTNIIGSAQINGIYDGEPGSSTIGSHKFYHNSVYIGGTAVVSGTINTYAFRRNNTNISPKDLIDVRNNIFVNNRSNTSGTGSHYAIGYDAATQLSSGTEDYNVCYTNGTGGVLAQVVGATTPNCTTYALLRTGSGNAAFDLNSQLGDPQFINTISATPNLHINTSVATPIEAAGTASATTTYDIDGDIRANYTPVDIGADAGNFIGIDLTAPTINVTPPAQICNASSITFTALISDGSGVNVTAGTAPRLYYKRSTDANAINGNTSATAGWKYVESTSGSSPFTFNLNLSLLNSGSTLNAGEVLNYFVVAQDQGPNVPTTPNVAINTGTFASTPTSVNLATANLPTTPSSMTVMPCSGTVTVGTGGNYTAFTTATGIFQAINATTLTGDLTINVISNITIEDGTNALNQWAETGVGGYKLLIQSNAAANRDISGAFAGTSATNSGLFRLNGADRVKFSGGTGNNRYLTFRNTNTGAFASTFYFLNDATNDTIFDCIVEGGGTNTVVGTIYIGTAANTGNDNVAIMNSDIRDLTTTTATPYNAIYALGTAGKENSCTVANCNIFNYFVTSTVSNGILVSTGNAGWLITGNNLYQTTSRSTASNDQIAIQVSDATSTTTISNNIIGYATNTQTGTITYGSSSGTPRFIGIQVNAGVTNITGNQIQAITLSTNSGGSANFGIFSGIYLAAAGSPLASGTISGNTIGSISSTATATQLNITDWTTGGVFYGIRNMSAGTGINITNNNIGNVTLICQSPTGGVSFHGINSTAGTNTISGNTIGSTSQSNSVAITSTAGLNNPAALIGIQVTATSLAQNITGNTIANMSNSTPSTNANSPQSPGAAGIIASGAAQYTINNNIINNLTSAVTSTTAASSSAYPATVGIYLSSTNSSAQSVSGNIIHTIGNTAAVASVTHGIYFYGGSSVSNAVAKNFVHSLTTGTAAGASIYGIYLANGAGTTSNNMVRLGINGAGSSITAANPIIGIVKDNTSANNIYFNTVYIGGTGVSTTVTNTFAFKRLQTGTDVIKNNIFVNARSNSTTGGLHYAYVVNAATNVTSNNNLYYASGTGGSLFSINGGTTAISTLQALSSSTGLPNQDLSSGIGDPQLQAPTGTNATVNLHLGSTTPAEGAGVLIASITDDIDGDSRASNTPTDIGADATNSTGVDIFKPLVTVATVSAQAPCGGTLSVPITATVTDIGAGVNTTTYPPTLWWRLNTGSWASVAPTSFSGNTFNFTLNITGVTTGQTYQYYVVAQDLASTPNINYSSFDATSPMHANTTATPSPTNNNPSSFTTVSTAPLSGTVNVGSGQTYTSLTGVNGLFAAINANGLSSNLTVNITSSTAENGTYSLYQWTEYCGTGYTVKIVPASATQYTLSGSLIGMGMFNIYASRVSIDGRYAGGGRYLKFVNTYSGTGGSENDVFKFDYFGASSFASNDTIRYCEIVGNSQLTAGGVIYFSSGCYNMLIDNNLIHGGTGNATNIILASGALSSNHDITISNNEIYNFYLTSGGATRSYGINITVNSNGNNWNIIGNSIYNNNGVDAQNLQTAINFAPGNSTTGHLIQGNYIGGSSAQCGTTGLGYWGNNWDDGSTTNELSGIVVQAGDVTILNNTFHNIANTNPHYGGITLIKLLTGSGNATIHGNTFGMAGGTGIDCNGGTTSSANGFMYGIASAAAGSVVIDSNVFNNIYFNNGGYNDGYFGILGNYLKVIAHTGTGSAQITRNSITNCFALGVMQAGLSDNYMSHGIYLAPSGGSNTNYLIEGNNVEGPIINLGDWTNLGIDGIAVNGIYVNGASIGGTIDKNTISGLWNFQTNGKIIGLALKGTGNWLVKNNSISLDNNYSVTGSPQPDNNSVSISGISESLSAPSTSQYFYNTIYVGGTATLPTKPLRRIGSGSLGFGRATGGTGTDPGSVITLKNNIIINTRTGSSGTPTTHYTLFNYGTAAATNWASGASNYNFLQNAYPASNCNMGYWNSTVLSTFNNWQNAGGTNYADANGATASYTSGTSSYPTTLNPSDLFVSLLSSGPDMHINITSPTAAYSYVSNLATPINSPSITDDIDGDTRNSSTPDIGADEFNACTAPSVTTNPSNVSVCTSASTSFTVTATGTSTLNYQWQVSTNGGSSFTDITSSGSSPAYSNYTSATLGLSGTVSGNNGYQYRCVVTNSCGTVTSFAATLNIQNPPTAVTVSGGGTYCGSSTLTATGGSGGTIYWQNTYTGGTNSTTASTSQSVSTTGTYYFRAQSSAGCWGTEGSASVVILPAPNSSSTWTGTIDGDWFKYQNWTNCVPGSITDVIIPAGLTNYPNTYSANPTSNSISIASTATLTLNGGYTLVNTSGISNAGTLTVTGATTGIQLGGDWTNTGTFNAGTGTGVVKFVGTATSIITPGSSLFNHITVEKTGTAKVTLASDITTNGILKINSGVLEIPSGTTANSYQIINNVNGTINIKSSGSLRKN